MVTNGGADLHKLIRSMEEMNAFRCLTWGPQFFQINFDFEVLFQSLGADQPNAS